LSEEAAELLAGHYVSFRSEARKRNPDGPAGIPITVRCVDLCWLFFLCLVVSNEDDRQLEAIVRISESLAKMSLQPVASVAHVQVCLFRFSLSLFVACGLADGCLK
jgi:DNA replication licensing factor MCM5